MKRAPVASRVESGFVLPSAIFLLVMLAALGAYMVSLSRTSHLTSALDVQGVRAYQAARAGMEWGAHRVLDPNNSLNPATCSPTVMPACPASPTHLAGLPGSLAPFTVTVTCTMTADTTEGNRNVRVFTLVAEACNQPVAGACPNPAPAGDYVNRQLLASVSKCKDPTAAAPRCECG
jgi:MSHA biogenesis protein MshP